MVISILTSSPTTTPPASSAAFHFKPYSIRLIEPEILNAYFTFPQGSFTVLDAPIADNFLFLLLHAWLNRLPNHKYL